MREDIESLLAARIVHLQRVERGYTPAARATALLADGRRVFVKQAVHDQVVDRLRQEHHIYDALGPQPFMPRLLAWRDGDQPILVLEDLSDATWPPPWTDDRARAVLVALDRVAATPAPAGLCQLAAIVTNGWRAVLDDPEPFLGLGLCDGRWLARAGPVLADAVDAAPLAGSSLLHFDVRSDNICIRDGGAIFVDWDHACVGNALVDRAFWLPSLAAEGGPSPDEVMPSCPKGIAALVAGFFASQAGLPLIPHAPRVRDVQREQLVTALSWVRSVFEL